MHVKYVFTNEFIYDITYSTDSIFFDMVKYEKMYFNGGRCRSTKTNDEDKR